MKLTLARRVESRAALETASWASIRPAPTVASHLISVFGVAQNEPAVTVHSDDPQQSRHIAYLRLRCMPDDDLRLHLQERQRTHHLFVSIDIWPLSSSRAAQAFLSGFPIGH